LASFKTRLPCAEDSHPHRTYENVRSTLHTCILLECSVIGTSSDSGKQLDLLEERPGQYVSHLEPQYSCHRMVNILRSLPPEEDRPPWELERTAALQEVNSLQRHVDDRNGRSTMLPPLCNLPIRESNQCVNKNQKFFPC
jgi:hypothetical protein